MTAKRVTKLIETAHLRVTLNDGTVHDYTTTPIDSWRTEKITGQSLSEAAQTFTGIASLAYSCALRANHAYRPKRATTDLAGLLEEWLTGVADISQLEDDIDDREEERELALPLDTSSSTDSPE